MRLNTTKFVLLNVFSLWNNYKNTPGALFILISFVAFGLSNPNCSLSCIVPDFFTC